MNNNQPLLKQYNEEEIIKLLNSNEKMVYVDTGTEEIVARYKDLPDIIVDINNKIGIVDLKIYNFRSEEINGPIITTYGQFLNKCDSKVREDIIDRLVKLQRGEEEIKDYKVIDEDMLNDVEALLEHEEMER